MITNKSAAKGSLESYKLSDEDVESVYKTIFQNYAAGYPSLEFPRFVIIGAQPAAGKTVISSKIRAQFTEATKPVHIDLDDLRPEHPLINRIMTEDPMNMGGHTHADAGIWTGLLLRDARMNSNSIIYEVTLRSPEWTKSEIDTVKKEGYDVEMYVLAVHENVSRLGLFQRFEGAIEKAEIPRYVPVQFHDDAYKILPASVDYLERNCQFQRVAVHNRNGQELYIRIDQKGEPNAMGTILQERTRAWTDEEKQEHMKQWLEVANKAIARPSGLLKPDDYLQVMIQSMKIAASFTKIDLPIPAQEQDFQHAINQAQAKLQMP